MRHPADQPCKRSWLTRIIHVGRCHTARLLLGVNFVVGCFGITAEDGARKLAYTAQNHLTPLAYIPNRTGIAICCCCCCCSDCVQCEISLMLRGTHEDLFGRQENINKRDFTLFPFVAQRQNQCRRV